MNRCRSGVRVFCPSCGAEMIHRDYRRFFESASALGQVIFRDGPRTFTVGDIDIYVRRQMGETTLLRLIEHKEPEASLKRPQTLALANLSSVIDHAIDCPDAPFKLDRRSGVYLMRGRVEGQSDGRHEVALGPQRVGNRRAGWTALPDQAALFRWLEGRES